MELERLQNQTSEISQLRKENEELRDVVHKLKVMILTIIDCYLKQPV